MLPLSAAEARGRVYNIVSFAGFKCGLWTVFEMVACDGDMLRSGFGCWLVNTAVNNMTEPAVSLFAGAATLLSLRH